jgi:hypothetical protein
MELAGRYFGSAFGADPVHLMMQGIEEPEMSTEPFRTMGEVTSPRVPEPLKPSDYMLPKQQVGRFLTDSKDVIRQKRATAVK